MATKGVKHSFGIKGAGVGAKTEQGRGRVAPPPAGTYAAILLQMKLSENRSGDPMLTCIFQLKITNPKLKKHDGFWVWHRFNITEQSVEYINGFLNCLAGNERKGLALQNQFWGDGGITTLNESAVADVLSIGNFKINSPKGTRPIVVTVMEDVYTDTKGNEVETVVVTKFAPAGAAEESADEEADDDADVEDTDADFDDEADDEAETDDETGDDEADDDGLGDTDDDEADELEAELKGLDLRALRLKARDEYDIAAADTKGKTEEEVIAMILEAAAEGDDDGLDDDLDEEPEEKPAPAKRRRGTKGNPPF